jgi:acyl-coenzyme A thioesterase PaaI-like protein
VPDALNEQIMSQIHAVFEGVPLELPPKVFKDMEGRFMDYQEGRSMRIAYPLLERYEGPGGTIQGGIVCTAFDNTYGPFSFLTSRAFTTTITLATSFVRPMSRKDREMEIEVFLVEQTRRMLFLEGRAYKPDGKLVATSSTEMLILPKPGG